MAPVNLADDGSTFAHWKMQGSAGESDSSGNARHLIVGTDGPSGLPMTTPAVIAGYIGNARHFINTDALVLATSAAVVAFLDGGWTLEFLVRIPTGQTGAPVLVISKPTTQVYGCLVRIKSTIVGFGGAGGISGFSEQTLATSFPFDEWCYVAIVQGGVSGHGGGTAKFEYYLNGVLQEMTLTSVGGASSPAAAALSNLVVGNNYLFPTASQFQNLGGGIDINEIRMSSVARTPTEIADAAIAYELLGSAPPDDTIPVVDNLTVADGVQIDRDTGAVGFDITDSGGNLNRTTVLCWFPFLQKFEVVWFGTSFGVGAEAFTAGFAPGYTGTRSTITNGFRFANVTRRGGWPSQPTIVTDAHDLAGNEDAS